MPRKPPTRGASGDGRRARISLARALSKLGHTSRSQARPLIESGQVSVNDRVVRDPEHRIDIERDRVSVSGEPVAQTAYVYLMMNKPAGVVTTRADEKGRRTVFDLLAGAGVPHLSAVGRLDLESEGLLLFTNDTRWANRIASPEGHVDKIYHVDVPAPLSADTVSLLEQGVTDRGETLKAKRAQVLTVSNDVVRLEIVLDEGRNRQIRRMLAAVGLPVLRLQRVAIGTVQLGKLKPGAYRPLTSAEIAALTRQVLS